MVVAREGKPIQIYYARITRRRSYPKPDKGPTASTLLD